MSRCRLTPESSSEHNGCVVCCLDAVAAAHYTAPPDRRHGKRTAAHTQGACGAESSHGKHRNAKFTALFGRPIQDSRAVGYEFWSGPQCVCNFLSVRRGKARRRALRARCERGETGKIQLVSLPTSKRILCGTVFGAALNSLSSMKM
jgi:hypothetical protein